MTPTVSEPVRDEDDGLVPCPNCVHGTVNIERGGRIVKRQCRECKGNPGRVLPEPIRFDLSHLLLKDVA